MHAKRIVLVLSIAFLFLQAAPFLISAYKTPPGHVYLGTIHHPQDYFYYLSQFAQGKERWFLSPDLYTSEFREPVIIGWVNVFLGRFFSFIRVEPVASYLISTLVSTGILFGVGYLFIRHIFGSTRQAAIGFAFIFFILGNAYPTLVHGPDGTASLWFFNYWFNLAEPLTRFSNVPHQALGNAAIIIGLLAGVLFSKEKFRGKKLFFTSILLIGTGVLLGSVQPVQWVITGVIVAITNVLILFLHKRQGISIPALLFAIYPSLLLFAGGFPFAITLKELVSTLPYSQIAGWESSQQILAPPYYVFLAGGPVISAAFLGIVPVLKLRTPGRIATFLYFAATSLLFLSPIPKLVGIQNVRFLSAATYLTASIMAADGLWYITSRIPKPNRIRALVLAVFFVLTVPVFWLQVSPRFGTVNTQNAFIFLEQAVIDGYKEARRISTPQDTFIAYWPMDVSFPGITGRRGFMGHPLLTIDNEKKNGLAYHFLIGKISQEEAKAMLEEHHITYILAYNDTFEVEYPFLHQVYRNTRVTLYKITLP